MNATGNFTSNVDAIGLSDLVYLEMCCELTSAQRAAASYSSLDDEAYDRCSVLASSFRGVTSYDVDSRNTICAR